MPTLLGLDKSKFTTIQGDFHVAFKGADNLTELSFKPYIKGELTLSGGVLDLTQNDIAYIEIEATSQTDSSASVISSLTGDIVIEGGIAFANFGKIIGSGMFNLKVNAVTLGGLSIVLVGPQLLSAPVLQLFADPDAIDDTLRSDKTTNIILTKVRQLGETIDPNTYDTAVYTILDGVTEKLSLSLGAGISTTGEDFRIAVPSVSLDFSGDYHHTLVVGITGGDSFTVFNRKVRVI